MLSAGPIAECTAPGRSVPASALVGPERPERLQARVDVVGRVVVGALVEALAADEAQAGAVRAAERRDRLGQEDRLADGRLEVELVVVGQAEQVVLAGFRTRSGGRCGGRATAGPPPR